MTSNARFPRSRTTVRVALCLKNTGCGDLELRKLYPLIADRRAAAEGCLRVVDESAEDYLYPAAYFAVVRVPANAARTLQLVA